MTKIVILGAGYGGLEAAKTLAKKLKKQDSVSIDLINAREDHILLTELHEVAGNRIGSEGVAISLEDILAGTDVNVIKDKIIDFELEDNRLIGSNDQYDFDYLVLGVGSEPGYFDIPGLEEHSFTIWSLDQAREIRNQIQDMFKLAANETDLDKRRELLTFVIGGGGFTGVETAGEIAEWVEDLCQEYAIAPSEVSVKLVEALDNICPVMSDRQRQRARKHLENQLGVEVITRRMISSMGETSVTLKPHNSQQEKIIPTRTLIWTGGIKAKEILKRTGLELNDDNRVKVNKYLQSLTRENVFAIGDNAYFKKDDDRPLPQLVEAAVQGGKAVGRNLAALIKGKNMKEFKPSLHGLMVSLGSGYGVAELKPIPGISIPFWGFLAMFMKHLINMHYLFEVGKFSLVGDYINQQFYDIRGGIGMLIRHLSKKTGTFWLVLLRVFLGVRFLMEGISKTQEGWLFGSEEQLVSGASSVLWNSGTPDWYIDLAKTFIVPNQVLFQRVMVITELLLGLSFIFGLLTVLAALVSMAMSVNFIMGALGSTAGIWEPVWLFLISVTMLSGAGKAFGLDYYLIPWLFNLSNKPVRFREQPPA